MTDRADCVSRREIAELRKKLAVMRRMTVEEIVDSIRRSGDIDYGTSEPSWAIAQWIWDRFRNEPQQTRGREEASEMPVPPTPEIPEDLTELRKCIGRALTRINQLTVVSSVRQQRLLEEAQDYLAEALTAYDAWQERLMDEVWE